MAFGLPDTGGDFLPLLTFNAKSGRFSLVEKVEGRNGTFEKEEQELETSQVVFVADFSTARKGWLLFRKGGAPVKVVNGIEDPMPPEPEGDFGTDDKGNPIRPRGGFILHVVTADHKLREFASNATACVNGMGAIMDQYLDEAAAHPGQIPMVRLVKVAKVGRNQNYQPTMEIVKWVDRKPDEWGAGPAITYRPRPAASARPSMASQMNGGGGNGAGNGADLAGDRIPF